MPISNPSLPTVPAGLHVGGLALDAAGLVITARTTAAEASCPVCGSADTEELSEFGATACKALRRCRSCREPFEHVKEI